MRPIPLYLTGEPICGGDLVKIGDLEGVVESIITPSSADWADYWRNATGEGVMLAGPAFGSMFANFHDEDLRFVRRKQEC